MSAAPELVPAEDPHDEALTVREAAVQLGIAESTLRRAIKRAADERQSSVYAVFRYRGAALVATRDRQRQPWTVRFDRPGESIRDVSHEAVARVDGRITELRGAMVPRRQESALEHTHGRRWWKFWA